MAVINWDAVVIGESCEFYEDVTAELIHSYADLIGDRYWLHIDDDCAANTPYGRPIAHGTLVLGLMSRASTMLSTLLQQRGAPPDVSLGYNRVRFTAPVFAGDRITTTLTVTHRLEGQGRVLCDERCVNQRGEVVAVAEHIIKFV